MPAASRCGPGRDVASPEIGGRGGAVENLLK